MIFIAVGGRNYRRAKYLAEGIPPKIAGRISDVRKVQLNRLKGKFKRRPKGLLLYLRMERAEKKTSRLGRRLMEAETSFVKTKKAARAMAQCKRHSIVQAEAQLAYFSGLLEFARKQKGTYSGVIALLEDSIEEVRADLDSKRHRFLKK